MPIYASNELPSLVGGSSTTIVNGVASSAEVDADVMPVDVSGQSWATMDDALEALNSTSSNNKAELDAVAGLETFFENQLV